MKQGKIIAAGMLLAGSLAVTSVAAYAQDGILFRQQAGNTNYCHLKFPAMQEHTLDWAEPKLKPASSGDIVDFYGPCDHNPTGKQEVLDQRQEQKIRWSRNYAS